VIEDEGLPSKHPVARYLENAIFSVASLDISACQTVTTELSNFSSGRPMMMIRNPPASVGCPNTHQSQEILDATCPSMSATATTSVKPLTRKFEPTTCHWNDHIPPVS